MDVHTFKEMNFRKSLYNNYLHFIFSVPKIGYKFLKIGYAFSLPAAISAPAAIPAGFLSLPFREGLGGRLLQKKSPPSSQGTKRGER